ncbi:MAG: acyltransferase family protein, partial [Acidimicrobiales bacterium]
FFSVSLFFTLSGFLITTLLLREHRKHGRIDLRRFWLRRVRRLMPVALFGLGLAAAVAYVASPPTSLPKFAGDIRFAALNVVNWRFALGHVTYGDAISGASPVTHYWSLAVEEQFYLVFPVLALLALRRSRACFAGVLVLAAGLSIWGQLVVEQNRAYLGTDTRMSELAIGGLAALGWTALRRRPDGRLLDRAGLAALAVLVVLWTQVDLHDPLLFRGILPLHAVAVAVLVIAAIDGRVTPKVTGFRPFAWLGERSYGVYVVHFPLYLLLTSSRLGQPDQVVFAARVAASIGLAAVLHIVVENPIRFGPPLVAWRGRVAAASAIGIALLLATALPNTTNTDLNTTRVAATGAFLPSDTPTVVAAPTTVPTTEPVSSTSEPGGASVAGARPVAAGSEPSPAAASEVPPPAAPRAVRLVIAGDSTSGTTGVGIQQWGLRTGRLSAEIAGNGGCALLEDGVAVLREQWLAPPIAGCELIVPYAVDAIRRNQADALIFFIGSNQMSDWLRPGSNTPVALGDPTYDALYSAKLASVLDGLAPLGIPVLFTSTPTPNWDPSYDGFDTPGVGPITMNNATRAQRYNDLTRAVVARYPFAAIVPYAERVARPDGSIDPAIRPDGLHILSAAIPAIMDAGLESDMASAYVRALAGTPTTGQGDRSYWSP